MTQRPLRSKSKFVNRQQRLQLEQLESRTVLANAAFEAGLPALDWPSTGKLIDARSVAFVAVMKAPSELEGTRFPIATVIFRPDLAAELPEFDTEEFELTTQDKLLSGVQATSFGESFDLMSSTLRMQHTSLAGLTIRFGEPDPLIRNPVRSNDTPSFPSTRNDNPSDPLSLSGNRAAQGESWALSQTLDADDEALYDRWQGSATWSEAYAQSTTLLDASAVDQVWSTFANTTQSADEELPSEQLRREDLDQRTSGDDMVSLDDNTQLDDGILNAKEGSGNKSAILANKEQRKATSVKQLLDGERDAMSDKVYTRGQAAPAYEEGGLADVTAVPADARLVQSPVEAVLRRVTPEVVSAVNVRDALELLPREWSAEVAAEAIDESGAPTLSTAYLGSFAVVVAASIGVVVEHKRRAHLTGQELPMMRKRDEE